MDGSGGVVGSEEVGWGRVCLCVEIHIFGVCVALISPAGICQYIKEHLLGVPLNVKQT